MVCRFIARLTESHLLFGGHRQIICAEQKQHELQGRAGRKARADWETRF